MRLIDQNGHVDGSFAYFVECPTCGAVYEMGTAVDVKRVAAADGASITMDTN